MTISNVCKQLKSECIELYLTKSDTGYFSAPEIYTPLYRILYENLLDGRKPPYFKESEAKKVKNDIKKCNSTFDRYLVAIFPSRYEASNPLKIKHEDLKERKLLHYLKQKYSKSSTDIDSYNISRKINELIDIADPNRADFFRKTARSSIYKLLTLSYKLSLINKQWMILIRYIDPIKPQRASMDNIVNFNLISDENARLNSAIAKMFYCEIDAGKPDGDKTYSRRMIELPTYATHLSELIKKNLINMAKKGEDISQLKEYSSKLIEDFRTTLNSHCEECYTYKDNNLELMDAIQYNMLLNIELNSILAKGKIEQRLVDYKIELKNDSDWLNVSSKDDEISIKISKELNIDPAEIKKEHIEISKTLLNILSTFSPEITKKSILSRNVCLIIVTHIKLKGIDKIPSNISGSKANNFTVYNELKKAHDWLSEHAPEIKDKHNISIIRPTCIYLCKYLHDKLLWQINTRKTYKNNIYFSELSTIHHKTMHSMLSQLRHKNHVQCLNAINDFYNSNTEEHKSLTDEFLNSISISKSFYDMTIRSNLQWSPLKT